MFDAQKLLGQLLREAAGGGLGGSRRRSGRRGSLTGLPRGLEAKVGMGLLGLAIAAFEHFRQAQSGAAPAAAPPQAPMPAPMPMAAARTGAMPPPPPPGNPMAARADTAQDRSLHLLRVMIAAAHADGAIDPDERAALLDRARDAGLEEEEMQVLETEIARPLALDSLLRQTPPELREEAYVAALVAIDVDDPREHAFIEAFGNGLQLDAATQARLRAQFEPSSP